MNLIEYVLNKKEILEELEAADKIDRDYDILRSKYAKLKAELEDCKKQIIYLEERQERNLKRIKEQRKEIKELRGNL